jgi:hypothetical protein
MMNLGITLSVEENAPRAHPRPEETAPRWCPGCAAEVTMVSLRKAARLDFTDLQTIYLWAAAGTVHSVRTPDWELLICLDSLLR